MTNIEEIRKELKGRTGMMADHEEDLLERIAVIEESDGVVAPLEKADWGLVIFCILVMGIAPVIWYAVKLF